VRAARANKSTTGSFRFSLPGRLAGIKKLMPNPSSELLLTGLPPAPLPRSSASPHPRRPQQPCRSPTLASKEFREFQLFRVCAKKALAEEQKKVLSSANNRVQSASPLRLGHGTHKNIECKSHRCHAMPAGQRAAVKNADPKRQNSPEKGQ
jgi:hypothetical protein